MDQPKPVVAMAKRLDALESAVLALIEFHAGRAGFVNAKAYTFSSAIWEAREEWDALAESPE